MITFTEHASEVLKTFLAGDPEPSQALRISVSGPKTAPRFDLTLVEHTERADDERSIEASGFAVLVRDSDVELLDGATVDYVERVNESGFEVRLRESRPGRLPTR
ncbi:MAG: HesB/IscA family protein [Longimicrobiales bacterium]